MPRIRECLYEEKNHHGTTRYRFIRKRGAPKIGIKGKPGDAAFEERYLHLLNGGDAEHQRISLRRQRRSKYDEGTYADLVDQYLAHMDTEVIKGSKSSGTRSTYSGILKRSAKAIGPVAISSLTRVDINQVLSVLTVSAATHNNMLKAMRAMFGFAVDQTHGIRDDPTQGIKYMTVKTDGHKEWTHEQIVHFLDFHPKGTTAHLVMTLFLYTSCRRSDVVKLGPQNLTTIQGKTYLEFHQTKENGQKGSLVVVPIDEHFMDVWQATRTGSETFVLNEYGKPFSVKGFGNRMKKWVLEAGLPDDIASHGVRKSIGSMMAEADCSNYQIMAMQGHSSPKASEVYTRKAKRRILAEQGRGKANLGQFFKEGMSAE